MSQDHNFRIEFFGGPNDGEVSYQRAIPTAVIEILAKVKTEAGQTSVEVHTYSLKWLNTIQAQYVYGGVKSA